ncbi:MAG: succinate dehydrogenase cytochrome b subunit [Acidobacteria bacterium]|nr:succinate dehydrogenase cytochrome b subunit [Acidobacteriota bacterium]
MSSTAGAVVVKPAPTTLIGRIFTTTVGQKFVMAATGAGLSFFVLAHMLANLNALVNPAGLDAYGAALRKLPALLWGARLGLLAATGLHVWAYLALTGRSWSARPQGYKVTAHRESTWASRTMRWTGPILAAFIIFHLLDLTVGILNPGFEEGMVYRNLKASLARPRIAAFYLFAMAALAFHLYHGIWSMFQTVGINQPRYESFGRKLAAVFTLVVAGGFALVPAAMLLGLLK